VIGREGPVRPFELIRWARAQARIEQRDADGNARRLTQLEAHALLVLASYANAEAKAWPSIRSLALDCGLVPRRPERKDGKASAWRNDALSKALDALQDFQLIWSKRGGPGRPATRELLFNPDALPPIEDGRQDQQPPVPATRRGRAASHPSAMHQKYQTETVRNYGNGQTAERPEVATRRGRAATDRGERAASDESPEEVRQRIRASLAQAAETGATV